MKYGIENIFINEPLSLFLSIFLILGISNLESFFKVILRKYSLNYITNHFFSPIFGTYILIIFLYPLTLLGLNNNFLFKFIAILLFFYLGFYFS